MASVADIDQAQDPRALRSRAALIAAMTDLLDERDAVDIAITEVVARAGVSRPTFYQHAGDLAGLITAAARHRLEAAFGAFDRAHGDITGPDGVREMIAMLVTELHAHRDFYRRALLGPSSHDVAASAIAYFTARIRSRFLGPLFDGAVRPDAADRATAIVAGLVWLVTEWLGTGFTGRNAPDAFASRVLDVLLTFSGLDVDAG